jgi:hypothetical protein
MKNIKLLFLYTSLFFVITTRAQNVGIGTNTPVEKLDVNGNLNIRSQLKLNGDSGKVNQVLMKNTSNNLVWGDLSQYTNIAVFDCPNIASSAGASNCSQGWTVPTGVTRVLIECWGGGGGGCSMGAGGGGGYISCILTTVPGNLITFTIGAGGVYGTSSTYGILGGNTSFSYGGANYAANGGAGGNYGDPFATNVLSVSVANGGSYSSTSGTYNFLGFYGQPGGYSKLSFMQTGATEFAKVVQYGDGGDAAMLPGSGGKGGYRISSATYLETSYAVQQAPLPGGGGAADYGFGWSGRGGRVIIHW